MGHHLKTYTLLLLGGALILSLTACAPETPAPASDSPAPHQTAEVSPAPSPSPAPSAQVTPSPDPEPVTPSPEASGDVPATYPDQETTLSYQVDGVSLSADALLRHSLQGYSIVYDTEHYICQQWGEGDSYWASEGNYLSVSLIQGLPLGDVLEGLRLQEDILEEAQAVTIGAGAYSASTLSVRTDGVFRQFWAVELASGDVLLIEQSFVEDTDTTPLYQASQAAMLETLTLI